MKHNKKAFSFVELMMVLVFFFIILAALMPMITRRHLAPPQKVNHGTYACYRDNAGVVRETLMKGKKTIIDDQVAAGGTCNFEPPTKARYFYVQLIGGGGGGKDINDEDLLLDAYKIKGSYAKVGGTIVQDSGSPSDWTGLLDDAEYNTLVGSKKLILSGTSNDGEVCSSSYYSWESRGCGDGVEDSDPYCKIGIGSGTGEVPTSCVTPTPSGFSKSAGMLQHTCTAKAEDPKVCESCPSVTCTVPVTAETPDGKKDYNLGSSTNMVSTRCTNNKNGSGISCYRKISLSSIGRNIIDHSYTWSNNPSLCGYVRGGVPRQSDGYGHVFSVGSTNLLRICGGEGAQTGKNKYENPVSAYYNHPYHIEYCSTPDEYKDAANGSCLDIPSSSEGGEGTEPTSLNPEEYLYPGVGIYDVKASQSQVIPYGVGGRAGQIKTLILKKIPENMQMVPGTAGPVNGKGGDTTFGPGTDFPQKIAFGGGAGASVFTIDAGLTPYSDAETETLQGPGSWRTTSTESMDSRIGEKIVFSTFIRFVISYNNHALKERMEVFGRGGDGAATMTESTCAYKYEPIILADNSDILNSRIFAGHANVPVPTWTEDGVVDGVTYTASPCNGHSWVTQEDADDDPTTGYDLGYYEGALQISSHATGGQSGAIVISW